MKPQRIAWLDVAKAIGIYAIYLDISGMLQARHINSYFNSMFRYSSFWPDARSISAKKTIGGLR